MTDRDNATKNYCPVITVEGQGFYRGHVVKVNGKDAYYRPYDGSDFEEVAEEFAETLGRLVGEKLGHPAKNPEED